MKIIYPYNEILPKKKAHDVFIVQECVALAVQGFEVTLLLGKGSKKHSFFSHYHMNCPEYLHIQELLILRKNNLLNLSWNLPFFFRCQQQIRVQRPNFVITSVFKQAAFHISHKVPGIRYIYEVHELCYYPTFCVNNHAYLLREKKMLSQMDLIIVTTEALKNILLHPPYSLKNAIEMVPLAVQATALSPPNPSKPLIVMYIGQLYLGQGIPLLLSALTKMSNIILKIVGGTSEEIRALSKMADDLSVSHSVQFLGFIPPQNIPQIAGSAHAFVAPFENVGRMPYVAHTKLFEYAEWGRPIIAPRLSIVLEHFQEGKGVLLFEPGNPASLAKCMMALHDDALRQKLQEEIRSYSNNFSWKNRAKKYQEILSKL